MSASTEADAEHKGHDADLPSGLFIVDKVYRAWLVPAKATVLRLESMLNTATVFV